MENHFPSFFCSTPMYDSVITALLLRVMLVTDFTEGGENLKNLRKENSNLPNTLSLSYLFNHNR